MRPSDRSEPLSSRKTKTLDPSDNLIPRKDGDQREKMQRRQLEKSALLRYIANAIGDVSRYLHGLGIGTTEQDDPSARWAKSFLVMAPNLDEIDPTDTITIEIQSNDSDTVDRIKDALLAHDWGDRDKFNWKVSLNKELIIPHLKTTTKNTDAKKPVPSDACAVTAKRVPRASAGSCMLCDPNISKHQHVWLLSGTDGHIRLCEACLSEAWRTTRLLKS
jgi:hypothetical protein